MDITRFIAFGDRYLANQYYVVADPLGLIAFGAVIALSPWFAGWYAGKKGILLTLVLFLLTAAILGIYVLTRSYHEGDHRIDVPLLVLRILLVPTIGAALSSFAAWQFVSRRPVCLESNGRNSE